MVYQNFLKEFWSTAVAHDPFPSTNETEQRPLRKFLIKFSVLNGQIPLTLDFNTFCSSTGLDYNNGKYVLGGNYSSTEQVNSIQQLLAHCLITGTKDSVSPLPLAAKPKKGKSQTITLTLPKSQGPKVPGALSKKSKMPKSKRPPTKTKVTPPKPTEGSKQSHSVSSGIVLDPQDLERDIQLTSTGFPSTLDEGTHKLKPLPESTATHPKDSGGNKQPLHRDITSMTSDKGTAKTTPHPKGSLGDKDSGGNIPPNDMEPVHPPVADLSGTGAKKYDNTLPLTEHRLVKYLRKMLKALFTRISEDNWEKHKEVAVNYADLKASINDYYDENILIKIRLTREDENHYENANIPPPVPPTQQTPHTLSTIKLPILKKGKYDA
ncbi:hypothetical protein Tco_0674127 [Tanacetum coccineum]